MTRKNVISHKRDNLYQSISKVREPWEFQKKCAMRITELEDMESYVEVDSNEIETLINELFPKNLSHYFCLMENGGMMSV